MAHLQIVTALAVSLTALVQHGQGIAALVFVGILITILLAEELGRRVITALPQVFSSVHRILGKVAA